MGVAAVVLAAGLSSRMGERNKLLLSGAGGAPMIARTVDSVLASKARPLVVVVGHQADGVQAALLRREVRFVSAPDYADGLAASLRAGIRAVPDECSAAIVCLGDMPLVTAATIDLLLGAYDPGAGHTIVVPTFRGKRGNPVLWDRRFFPEILALSGDSGARRLFPLHKANILEIGVDDEGVLRDFDTPEALASASSRF